MAAEFPPAITGDGESQPAEGGDLQREFCGRGAFRCQPENPVDLVACRRQRRLVVEIKLNGCERRIDQMPADQDRLLVLDERRIEPGLARYAQLVGLAEPAHERIASVRTRRVWVKLSLGHSAAYRAIAVRIPL